MPKKEAFAKGRKICPFCGGESKARTSGEHLWSDWAEDLLPKRDEKHEFARIGQNGFETITEVKKDYKRQGSPSGIKIRGVCDVCNNGWMSRLENLAKPILTPLVTGGDVARLNVNETKIVARWIFLKFCITAFQDSKIWCVSELQRKAFMEHGEIPNQFSAWLFKHNVDSWYDKYRWFSTRAFDPLRMKERTKISDPHNVNTFTMGFGRVLFFCAFQWGVQIHRNLPKMKSSRIWPLRLGKGMILPNGDIGEDDADLVAHILPLSGG